MRLNRAKSLGMLALLAFFGLTLTAHGQVVAINTSAKDQSVELIINNAQQIYLEGVTAYEQKNFDLARRKFDEAVDVLFFAPIDINSDNRLKGYYRNLIDNISSLQVESAGAQQETFGVQLYTPTPTDELAQITDAELNSLGTTNAVVSATDFNFKASLAPPVHQFINYFTKGRGRQTMLVGLQRAGRYRALAERIFKEERVPTDLIWLAQVESLWSNNALSSAAAKGMWQFIPSTGARYGLAQNVWLDERSDPVKSTRAAARYLRYLADYFNGDWLLAMAAYNCGEGRVGNVTRRKGTTDYWTIRAQGLLPEETRNYVPAILAAIAIAKNPQQYGFAVTPEQPDRYDTHTVQSQTSLAALAKKLDVSLNSLVSLNPQLHRRVTPPGAYAVRIPTERGPAEFVSVPVNKQRSKRPAVSQISETGEK